jgi:hypothetical protein
VSSIISIENRGKSIPVRPVHRTDFKVKEPGAYACIEAGNRPIPSDFYMSETGACFAVFEGIIPLVLKWTGKRWVEVKP